MGRSYCWTPRHLAALAGLAVLTPAGPRAAAAQAPTSTPAPAPRDSAPPDTVAARFFRAVAASQWRTAAEYFDLARFDVYRRQQVVNARAPFRAHHLTVAGVRRGDPEMPRAVAVYQVRRFAQLTAGYNPLASEYGPGATADSLAAWPAAVAAARWLESRDQRVQFRRALAEQRAALRAHGCGDIPDSLFTAALRSERPRVVLGAVVADSEAWVLHRVSEFTDSATARRTPKLAAPPTWHQFPETATLPMRRVAGAWRIVGGDGMMNGTVAVGSSAMNCRPAKAGRRPAPGRAGR